MWLQIVAPVKEVSLYQALQHVHVLTYVSSGINLVWRRIVFHQYTLYISLRFCAHTRFCPKSIKWNLKQKKKFKNFSLKL